MKLTLGTQSKAGTPHLTAAEKASRALATAQLPARVAGSSLKRPARHATDRSRGLTAGWKLEAGGDIMTGLVLLSEMRKRSQSRREGRAKSYCLDLRWSTSGPTLNRPRASWWATAPPEGPTSMKSKSKAKGFSGAGRVEEHSRTEASSSPPAAPRLATGERCTAPLKSEASQKSKDRLGSTGSEQTAP